VNKILFVENYEQIVVSLNHLFKKEAKLHIIDFMGEIKAFD
jgi:hypothetical protein